MKATRQRPKQKVLKPSGAPRLIPVSPSPGKASFHPLGAYSFLCRLPNDGGAVLVFVDYRAHDPRREFGYTDLDCCNMHVELPWGIGAQLITPCGPGWLIYTLPFAGVHWRRVGTGLRIEVDDGERLRAWLDKLDNHSSVRRH